MTDRGNYRAVFETLSDDADFQNLSTTAQAVFWTLKMKLGQYGIGVFYTSTLPDLHKRAKPKALEAALAELEQPKPSRRYGWIRRERNVFWIVNGFRNDPWVNPDNANHRLGALRFVNSLPRSAVVGEFVAYYGIDGWRGEEPGEGTPQGTPHSIPGPSGDHGEATAMVGGIKEKEEEKDKEEDTPPPPRIVSDAEAAIAAKLLTVADCAALSTLMRAVPNPGAWLAEMRASLDQMAGHVPLTPEQLGLALRDYVGNGAEPNMALFRSYLRRAAKAKRAQADAPGTDGPTTDASLLVANILALAETRNDGSARAIRSIPKAKVAAMGEAVLKAYDAIGGAERLLTMKPEHRGLVVRDFEKALRAAGGNGAAA